MAKNNNHSYNHCCLYSAHNVPSTVLNTVHVCIHLILTCFSEVGAIVVLVSTQGTLRHTALGHSAGSSTIPHSNFLADRRCQGQACSSCKGLDRKYFGSAGPAVSVATTQPCCDGAKTAINACSDNSFSFPFLKYIHMHFQT